MNGYRLLIVAILMIAIWGCAGTGDFRKTWKKE